MWEQTCIASPFPHLPLCSAKHYFPLGFTSHPIRREGGKLGEVEDRSVTCVTITALGASERL